MFSNKEEEKTGGSNDDFCSGDLARSVSLIDEKAES